MRRLLALLLLVLPGLAAAGDCIDDDFSTDPFTSGRWNRSNSVRIVYDSANQEVDWVPGDTATSFDMYYTTAVSGIDQWVQLKHSGNNMVFRVFMRVESPTAQDPAVDQPMYQIMNMHGPTYGGTPYDQAWGCEDDGSGVTCGRVNGYTCWKCVPDTTWYAYRITGTGKNTTVFDWWACGESPCGTTPTDPSTWGASDLTLTHNGISAPLRETGFYVGLRYYDPVGNSGTSIRHFMAGEVGCTPAGGGGSPPPRRIILVTQALERLVPGQMRTAWGAGG